jgi:gliding motility-associated-like protein
MHFCKKSLVAVLLFVVSPTVFLYSEGTKQVMPNSSAKGQLCINKYRNDFAFFDGRAEFRLNISIINTSEKIRFGFGQVLDNGFNPVSDLVYQIKNSSGLIVYGPFPVPTSGKGYINTYSEAIAGPFAGGYNYLEIQPLNTGDYYLEFYYPPSYIDDSRHYLEFFDITVVNASGAALEGRVWSKAWQFGTGNDLFYAKMMILSDDSIVTQVNCNGFHGGSFSFSSNMTGCSNTSDLSFNRKSARDFHTYPQYKVFLNDPDNILYPTQKAPSGIILPVLPLPNCTTGGADFGIKVEKDESIALLIQINPNPGTDPEDVQIIADLKANPGGDGYNYITWDGNDNYGKPVANNVALSFTVTNLSGLTHLPIYDIENNASGFIVNQIRPAGGQLRIYWDDSNITNGSSNASTGCISSGGCHTWSGDFGNNNTINSWWYVTSSETADLKFTTTRKPGIPTISGNSVHCVGTAGNLDFAIANDPNSIGYKWLYSGTGVTITESGTKATLHFSSDATEGTLTVQGYNTECGDGPVTPTDITFESLPIVNLQPFQDICYTAPGFELTGGEPQGGEYYVDNNPIPVDSLFPYKEAEGYHRIVYSYTAPTTCSNSDTTEILLYSGTECLGTVYFPNAFKPDNDTLNNVFRPVVRNISSFKMYIYNRWGELLYTTDNVAKGWDGTHEGKACPEGTYTFTATYGQSLRQENIDTKRGMFTLVR